MKELRDLYAKVCESVRRARMRGARVEVHCAADTHFENALALPLDDLHLTVHPLCPRKPFAKLMDRASVLAPIIANAMLRLEQSPNIDDVDLLSTAHSALCSTQRVCVARWGFNKCQRYEASRAEVLDFFFGPDAPALPHPSEWFCVRCSR